MKTDRWKSLVHEVPADRLLDVMAILYLKTPEEAAVKVMSGLGGDDESSDVLHRVRLEYHDLFIASESGKYLPPYESFHLERCMRGASCARVQEIFQREGFDPAHLEVEEHWKLVAAPDHLGFELAFLSLLLRSAELPQADSQAQFAKARTFHAEHVATWAGEYGAQLAATARTVTYKTLGRLTMAVAEEGFLKK